MPGRAVRRDERVRVPGVEGRLLPGRHQVRRDAPLLRVAFLERRDQLHVPARRFGEDAREMGRRHPGGLRVRAEGASAHHRRAGVEAGRRGAARARSSRPSRRSVPRVGPILLQSPTSRLTLGMLRDVPLAAARRTAVRVRFPPRLRGATTRSRMRWPSAGRAWCVADTDDHDAPFEHDRAGVRLRPAPQVRVRRRGARALGRAISAAPSRTGPTSTATSSTKTGTADAAPRSRSGCRGCSAGERATGRVDGLLAEDALQDLADLIASEGPGRNVRRLRGVLYFARCSRQ